VNPDAHKRAASIPGQIAIACVDWPKIMDCTCVSESTNWITNVSTIQRSLSIRRRILLKTSQDQHPAGADVSTVHGRNREGYHRGIHTAGKIDL